MNITNATNFIVRNDSTNAYLKDIKKYPVMTKQEEMDLFAKYEDSVERLNSVKFMDNCAEKASIIAGVEKIQNDLGNEIFL